MGTWCDWPRPQAESVARQFTGDKSDELPSPYAQHFSQKQKMLQTQGRAGFPDPMGTV